MIWCYALYSILKTLSLTGLMVKGYRMRQGRVLEISYLKHPSDLDQINLTTLWKPKRVHATLPCRVTIYSIAEIYQLFGFSRQ